MEPAIPEGSIALVYSWAYVFQKPKAGNIVLAKTEYDDKIFCKRIVEVNLQTKQYFLAGDNPSDSLDSKKIGSVPEIKILGKIIKIFRA